MADERMMLKLFSMKTLVFALHDPAYARKTHQRIGDHPASGACQRAGDGELDQCRRSPRVQKKADGHEHRWMNDVYRVRTPVEPCPE